MLMEWKDPTWTRFTVAQNRLDAVGVYLAIDVLAARGSLDDVNPARSNYTSIEGTNDG